MRFLRAFTAIACAAHAAALSINIGGEDMVVERDAGLQDVVSFEIDMSLTWSKCRLTVNRKNPLKLFNNIKHLYHLMR